MPALRGRKPRLVSEVRRRPISLPAIPAEANREIWVLLAKANHKDPKALAAQVVEL
jgi:hypothetical protein